MSPNPLLPDMLPEPLALPISREREISEDPLGCQVLPLPPGDPGPPYLKTEPLP